MNATSTDTGKLILRLTIGILLLLHGISKLSHGIDGLAGMLAGKGLPGVLAYGVYIGEVLAPLLLIIGFRTRMAAVLVVINMLVAIFTAHAADIFTLGQSGGWGIELQSLFLFGALAIFFLGAGRYAVSNRSRWD